MHCTWPAYGPNNSSGESCVLHVACLGPEIAGVRVFCLLPHGWKWARSYVLPMALLCAHKAYVLCSDRRKHGPHSYWCVENTLFPLSYPYPYTITITITITIAITVLRLGFSMILKFLGLVDGVE